MPNSIMRTERITEIGRDGLSGCGIGAEPFPFGPGESDRYRIVFRAYSGTVFPESKKYGRIDDGEKQLAGCPARVDTSQIYGDPESAIVEFLSGYRDQYPMIEVCENQVIV